jgi:hypothetical protein
VDQHALKKLLTTRQLFFVSYYRRIVDMHPLGIEARRVKELARAEVMLEFGFDPFDQTLTGTNPSTHDSAASQWANNLISNDVLQEFMIVVPSRRVMLYPLSAKSNAQPSDDPVQQPKAIDKRLAKAADDREPRRAVKETTRSPYLRSAALAEFVRQEAQYKCIVPTPDCITFVGRDGHHYVEVHHVVPMSEQHRTTYNLDRNANMVAICAGCHTRIHRGIRHVVESMIERLLADYKTARKETLQSALSACELPCSADDLLKYYTT